MTFENFGPIIFGFLVASVFLIGFVGYGLATGKFCFLSRPKRAVVSDFGAGMNRYAATALTWASVFLMVMAVLVNSNELFVMAAAIIATMVAAHLQARLAVRALRFEHFISPAVKVGERVTVEVIVWSERRIKRPLVTIRDNIPARVIGDESIDSLPVAPSYEQPIKTRYSFRPIRRGRYKWDMLTATATDALGLVSKSKTYMIPAVELTVYPSPLPVTEDVMPLMGWGASDLDEGRHKGSGLEPHGIREYANGDPLRYVHWRSSARRGKLMVKEFETGSGVVVNLVLQRTQGTEVSSPGASTFEAMCGHASYLASDFVRKGATVIFPGLEPRNASGSHPEVRERQIREVLTDVQPTRALTLSQEIVEARKSIRGGETVLIFAALRDVQLPATISAWGEVQVTVLVYDSTEYGPLPQGTVSASDPLFIARLEASGARVIVLPRVEHLT